MKQSAMRAWILLGAAWLMTACGSVVRPGDGGGPLPDGTVVLPDGGGCVAPGGRVLAVGESFFDGCNTCMCGAGGVLGCTARACLDVTEPPPPFCSAPDGTQIPLGASWTSRDGCTECLCGMDGSLSCGSRSDCMDGGPPPPPVCIAPDGTPIPLGSRALTRDFCSICACTVAGGPAQCVRSGDARCGDAGGPLVCRAPDGSGVPVGGTWVSPDRCTRCVCPSSGLISCVSDPSCIPDAGVCVDSSGRVIPPGACFMEPCRSCCCTPTGLSCTPTGGPACTDGGVVPPVCNNVPNSTVRVTPRAAFGMPPVATGGTIADGYYVLRDLVFWGGGGSTGTTVSYAVQVTRGTMQFSVIAAGSPVMHANFSYTTGGSLIRLTPTCSDGSMAGAGAGQFSARPRGFELFIDSGVPGQVQQMVFAAP